MQYASDLSADVYCNIACLRIDRVMGALDIVSENNFNSAAVCLIEGPDGRDELLPADTVRVDLKEQEDGSRLLTMTFPEA